MTREPGEQVFYQELLGWPEVYKTGPYTHVVVARFQTPMRTNALTGRTWTSAGVFLAALPTSAVLTPLGIGLFEQMTEGKVSGNAYNPLFSFVAAFPITSVLLRWLRKNWLVTVRVWVRGAAQGSLMAWNAPPVGVGAVKADEAREFWAGPHRLAGEEERLMQKAARDHNPQLGRLKLPDPVYRISSEVFIGTGPRHSIAQRVAEIANDESQEKAGRLAAALDFVDRASQVAFREHARQEVLQTHDPHELD